MSEEIRTPEEQEIDLSEQVKIRREKLKNLQAEGCDPFTIVKYDVDTNTKEVKDNFEEGKQVTLAGRLMSKRVMGKASFASIQDEEGRIQLYVARDLLGEEPYAKFKKLDIGDIVGIKGEVFKTHTEEISVRVTELVLLSKSLQVLPEKYHGLKDMDLRYRQRYVDLIVNPEVKESFRKRSAIISTIRKYLDGMNYLEVETPILQTIPGGAEARPFITHHNALDIPMYMRIATELYLKRLIVGGFNRVYEIGRNFRNEGMDMKHNPEFTCIEMYQAYADYNDMMDLAENLIREACIAANGTAKIMWQDVELDLTKKFERITMVDCVKKYAGVDFNEIKTTEEAKKVAAEKGVEIEPYFSRGEIIAAFFDEFCEKNLIQPTFLTDYPVEISPLTKRKPSNPDYTERFELFINGWEVANAYSELNDPIDQRARFEYQESLREQGNDEADRIDEDFLTALEYGMPPTGGMGMGIDRLVMLLTNATTIRDVLLFPTMKPIKD